jgi:hypothetical protein
MPKLRPINLTLLKDGNKEESKRLFKDLLILTPRGMTQRLKATDYVKRDDHPGKDAYLIGTFDKTGMSYYDRKYKAEEYGYTSEAIYYALSNLGAEGTCLGEYACYTVVKQVTEVMYGTKVTRGGRRLLRRCSHAWKDAISSGVLGDMTWEVEVNTPSVGHSYRGHSTSADIRFAAKNKGEAEMMLATMFTHAIAGGNSTFKAWKVAEPADVMSANLREVKTLKSKRAKIQKEIEKLQQHLANIETLEDAITMYSLTALGEDN